MTQNKHDCEKIETLLTYDLAYYDPVEGMHKPVPDADKQTIKKLIEHYKTERTRNND